MGLKKFNKKELEVSQKIYSYFFENYFTEKKIKKSKKEYKKIDPKVILREYVAIALTAISEALISVYKDNPSGKRIMNFIHLGFAKEFIRIKLFEGTNQYNDLITKKMKQYSAALEAKKEERPFEFADVFSKNINQETSIDKILKLYIEFVFMVKATREIIQNNE